MKSEPKLEIILAFSFGVFFCLVLLGLSFFVKDPNDLAIFVTRVILSLAAAGVGAVVPGIIDFEFRAIPGVILRAGGAFALGALVYLVNPPELVSNAKKVRSSLMDVQFALARGNIDWAAGKLADIGGLLPNCPDIAYLQGVIDRRRGSLQSAERFFDKSIGLLERKEPCFVRVSLSEIKYQNGLLKDMHGEYAEARKYYTEVTELEPLASALHADALYERARLGLLLALYDPSNGTSEKAERQRLAAEAENDFLIFMETHWAGINRKHWAKYHLACLYGHFEPSQRSRNRTVEGTKWAESFFLTWRLSRMRTSHG